MIPPAKPASPVAVRIAYGWIREGKCGVALTMALVAFSILTWNVQILPRRTGALYVIVALAGAAMGIQSAAVRKLNLPGVVTTYITGTITALTSGFVRGIRRRYEASTSTQEEERNRTDWESRLEIQTGVLFVYGIAACMIAALHAYWPRAETFSPLIAVALALVATFWSQTNPEPAKD
jgi:uncharacterized membrane protein YoaK (UPF0700 family)